MCRVLQLLLQLQLQQMPVAVACFGGPPPKSRRRRYRLPCTPSSHPPTPPSTSPPSTTSAYFFSGFCRFCSQTPRLPSRSPLSCHALLTAMVDGLRNLPAVAFSFYYCYYKLSALLLLLPLPLPLSVAVAFFIVLGKFVHCMRLFVVIRSTAATTAQRQQRQQKICL